MGASSSKPKLSPKVVGEADEVVTTKSKDGNGYWESLEFTMGSAAMLSSGLITGYDLAMYGYLIPELEANFFHGSRAGAWLGFSVGYVLRPFGGVVFGWLGDTIGRKPASRIIVTGLTVGMMLPSVLPSALFVPSLKGTGTVAFLATRAVCGLMNGADRAVRDTYAFESNTRGMENLHYSLIWCCTAASTSAVSLGISAMHHTFTQAQMDQFGWRIVFALAVAPCGSSIFARSRMEESEAFEAAQAKRKEKGDGEKKDGILTQLSKTSESWDRILVGMVVTASCICVYTAYLFVPSQLVNAGRDPAFVYFLVGVGEFGAVLLIAAGVVGDYVGASKVLKFGTGITALTAYPALGYMMGPHISNSALAILLPSTMVMYTISCVALPMYNSGLYPTEIRSTCSGIVLLVHPFFGGLSGINITLIGKAFSNPVGVYIGTLNLLGFLTLIVATHKGIQKDPPTWGELHPPEQD